ncbi:unnamed protein product, partial [marine sediment metagenome]
LPSACMVSMCPVLGCTRLGKNPDVFMTDSRAIGDTFWHGVGLVPYNITPYPPAIGLSSKGYPNWDEAEVFGL